MGQGGECPDCGEVIAQATKPQQTKSQAAQVQADQVPSEPTQADEPAQPRQAPWHFKLLLGGIVVYLGYRAYQGVEWLAHHL